MGLGPICPERLSFPQMIPMLAAHRDHRPSASHRSRVNSLSDIGSDTRDAICDTPSFRTTLLNAMFTASNSVLPGRSHAESGDPWQRCWTGEELQFNVMFTRPFVLPAVTEFDAVWMNYCCRLCFPGYADADVRDALKTYRGVKLMSVQDEYESRELRRGGAGTVRQQRGG